MRRDEVLALRVRRRENECGAYHGIQSLELCVENALSAINRAVERIHVTRNVNVCSALIAERWIEIILVVVKDATHGWNMRNREKEYGDTCLRVSVALRRGGVELGL